MSKIAKALNPEAWRDDVDATEIMTPSEACEYAASWGSFMTSGDPGACMYGFDHDCRPQSEQHRQQVIDHMTACRLTVEANPDDYEENELETFDEFVEFITRRPLEGE